MLSLPRPSAVAPTLSLSALLARLEIPDCSCRRVPVPCRHLTAALAQLAEHESANGKLTAALRARWLKKHKEGCDCVEYCPPCPHILAAAQHQLDPAEWLLLLRHAHGRAYLHDYPRDHPSKALVLKHRVAVLCRRRRLHLSLWNDADWWARPLVNDDLYTVGTTRDGKRLLNGADDSEQAVRVYKP